ncbi:hypothetical protein L596_018316 [Steinernema carpocapsae]|uniref:acetate--CoA ligase n=1 Tax=Steinernema carpocapsae TaxID=34508 RepID=A0A4U5N4B9_STECR|nr:hypothetical protein L596_018316 [Steinernema carpocapsae]
MENLATLCLDVHLKGAKPDDPIVYKLHWEGNYWDGDIHDYAQLSLETVSIVAKKCARVLQQHGVGKGDTVVGYVPTVVQLPIIALGCANIGATFAFINPSDQDPTLLSKKLDILKPKAIICVDGFWRGTDLVHTKKNLDSALEVCDHKVDSVLVIRHTGPNPGTPPPTEEFVGRRPSYKLEVPMAAEERDFHWAKLISACPETEAIGGACEVSPEEIVATFLKLLPDGIQREEMTLKELMEVVGEFSSKHKPQSPFWVIGYPDKKASLIALMAAMIAGAEIVLFEGILSHPDPSRIGQVISKYEVQEIVISAEDVDLLMKFPDYVHFWKISTLKSVIYEGKSDDVDEINWLKEHFGEEKVKMF